MHRQIIQHNHIVRFNLWEKQLVDVGVEDWSINRSRDTQRSNDTLQPQGTDYRQVHAAITWDTMPRSYATLGASIESRHRQVKARLVNEDKSFALELSNSAAEQISGCFVSFGSRQTFFCETSPIAASNDKQSSDALSASACQVDGRLIHQALHRPVRRLSVQWQLNVPRSARAGRRHDAAWAANFHPCDAVSNIWRRCAALSKKCLRSHPTCPRRFRRHIQSFDVNLLSTLSC